jgi:hypothetical protein
MKPAIRNRADRDGLERSDISEGNPPAGWINPQSAILNGLPGSDQIRQGLADLAAGRRSIPACLVRIGRPRLARAGLMAPSETRDQHAELELYSMLADHGPNAHGRFNALLRELVSFEHALDHQLSRRNP